MSDYVARNREVWTKVNREYTDAQAREAWQQEEVTWGMFGGTESELGVLGDVAGKDVIELGCGTAYISAWLARRGARVTGVDITPAQLDTARRCQQEFGLEFPLIEASAEDVPLADASFDLALDEYGASIWCDPYKWIPEAARLLRPGGELVFLCNSTLSILCSPDEGPVDERLHRPQFGMHRFEWQGDDEGVDFHLAHGEWIRLLRDCGFEVEGLWELRAPEDAEMHSYYDFVSADWARKWPAEEIWKARKRV
ncbi:MAG TPA: methyltransferase domain-containing protein [Gaiellaceae bacterium]|nr:methyltransferase domain-containing protein [Gaiellaceae bacterium]